MDSTEAFLSQDMGDLLRELRKTGTWSYVLTKWKDQIDRELVATGLAERRELNMGWIKVAYRAVKAQSVESGSPAVPSASDNQKEPVPSPSAQDKLQDLEE